MPGDDERRPDEPADDTEVVTDDEWELREQARDLSIASDLDTWPPRHD